MPAISVSVKTKTLYDLEQAVKRTGWNKSKITEEALTRFFSELDEDAEDAKMAWFTATIEDGVTINEPRKPE